MAVFENWSLIRVPAAARRPGGIALQGEIFGDDRFRDGTLVTTSLLAHFDLEARLVRTRNTTYRLGSVDMAFWNRFASSSCEPGLTPPVAIGAYGG